MKLVVGIDPGTTSAVCALDLEKNVVFKKSKRGAGPKEMIRWITEKDSPVLICSDVYPAPETVKKIGSSFDAEVFAPEEDLDTEKKRELTEGLEFENDHEQDAMAAALNGFNSFESKLRKAKKLFEKRKENVWSSVFKEIKLKEAVRKAEEVEEETEKEQEEQKKEREKSAIEKRLRKKNRKLRKKTRDLEDYVDKLKKEKKELQEKEEPREINEEKIAKKKEKEIKRLKKRIKLKGKEIAELEKKLEETGKILKKVSEGELELKEDTDERDKVIETFGKYSVVREKEEDEEKKLTIKDLKGMVKRK